MHDPTKFQNIYFSKKKAQHNFFHSDLKCPFIRFSINHFSILGNVPEDSGKSSRKFWEMFKKVPGNVRRDPRECSGKLWEMVSILNQSKPRFI